MKRIALLVLVFVSIASGVFAEVRFYIVPKIGDGITPATAFRPKYTDIDSLGAGWNINPWSAMNYGAEGSFLLRVDTTPEQHTTLTAQVDVLALPANLDANISGAALPIVQAQLEGLNIPGNWVTTANTYRQVIKATVRIVTFAQRYFGLFPSNRLFGGSVTLSTTFNQLTAAQKQRLQATADSLGLDTSGVTNQMTIRQALKLIADQLPDLNFGGDTF